MIKLHCSEHEIQENCSTKIEGAKLWHFYPSPTYQSFIVVALGDTKIPYICNLTISSTMSAK